MPAAALPASWWIAGIAAVAGIVVLIKWLWEDDRP